MSAIRVVRISFTRKLRAMALACDTADFKYVADGLRRKFDVDAYVKEISEACQVAIKGWKENST